jgi:hypothetical protein
MAEIIPHVGLTLLDAYRAANAAGMHLIDNGLGDVRVSPIIPPGWREIPLRVKAGPGAVAERVAA